jgi:hypothetical protein
VHGSTVAFKPSTRTATTPPMGPATEIPKPAGRGERGLPGKSAATGYEREVALVEHYLRMGVPLAQARDLATGVTHQ